MRRVFLTLGGVMQIPAAALHVAMFFGLARATEIPATLKPLLHIFNAAVLAVVLFFAYVSLFRRRELLDTPLGHVVCWFAMVFYMQRGLVGAWVHGPNLMDLGVMLAVAALYIPAALPAGSAPLPASLPLRA